MVRAWGVVGWGAAVGALVGAVVRAMVGTERCSVDVDVAVVLTLIWYQPEDPTRHNVRLGLLFAVFLVFASK